MPYKDIEKRREYQRERSKTRILTESDIEKRKARDRKRHTNYMRQWRELTKFSQGFGSRTWKWAIKKKYGLTEIDFYKLLVEQACCCASCNTIFSDKVRINIDHCHETGYVRGLLCDSCNRTIGHAKEDPKRLKACALYLENKLASTQDQTNDPLR